MERITGKVLILYINVFIHTRSRPDMKLAIGLRSLQTLESFCCMSPASSRSIPVGGKLPGCRLAKAGRIQGAGLAGLSAQLPTGGSNERMNMQCSSWNENNKGDRLAAPHFIFVPAPSG